MTYKKDDILIFKSIEPAAHACRMAGLDFKKELEPEEYYGFVKSVISSKDGIYLMQTIKPLEGFICITETADIIRLVDKFELLTEAEQIQVCAQWSDDDWFKYFVSKGTITLDEFCEKLKIAAYKIANKKYGSDLST